MLVEHPDVPGAGAHLNTARIIGTAADAGVKRLVLLSSQSAGTRPDSVSHAPPAALDETVLGRPGRTFADWAERHAGLFVG